MRPIHKAVLILIVCCVAAAAPAQDRSTLSISVEKDALRAIDQGLRWLQTTQREDGSWSLAQFPAISALATQAYLHDPSRKPMEVTPPAAAGIRYILSCVREDGGIYCDVPRPKGGGLRNYNTAICMVALAASGDPSYDPVVGRARDFLARMQHRGDDEYDGGFGYDADLGRAYADMTNTMMAVEALWFTKFVVDNSCAPPLEAIRQREPVAGDAAAEQVDWDAAVKFLSRCQNRPGADHPVSLRPEDAGGFFYEPNGGKAGSDTDAEGRPIYYTHGTATYGALMSLLYAQVDRDDPRVRMAVEWIRRNWTLDEHPGCGREGLYFHYYTIAKALRAYGEEPLTLEDGTKVDWRKELAVKLCSLQRIDPESGLGYWVNDVGRWMENDPVLVTAYSLLTLEMLVSETPF